MSSLYGVSENHYSNEPKPSQSVIADWTSRPAGPPIKKLMTACLLYPHDKDEAAKIARGLAEDAAAPATLRADALQIVWLGEPASSARAQSIDAVPR